jgi:hypothetical protein
MSQISLNMSISFLNNRLHTSFSTLGAASSRGPCKSGEQELNANGHHAVEADDSATASAAMLYLRESTKFISPCPSSNGGLKELHRA